VYNRDTLMMIRNSPLSQTPPNNLPKIPGVTAPDEITVEVTFSFVILCSHTLCISLSYSLWILSVFLLL
jgi:hypothetical protein